MRRIVGRSRTKQVPLPSSPPVGLRSAPALSPSLPDAPASGCARLRAGGRSQVDEIPSKLLGQALNPEKTRLVDFDRGFKFLGHLFVRSMVLKSVEPDAGAEPAEDATARLLRWIAGEDAALTIDDSLRVYAIAADGFARCHQHGGAPLMGDEDYWLL